MRERTGMRKRMTMKTILMIGALLFAPFALAGCGETVADHTVGPVGPTSPGGYYFEAKVSPHTIPNESNVLFTVRVWDSNGNVGGGVPLTWSGGQDDAATSLTNVNGYAYLSLVISGNAGGIAHITVTIEDKTVTIPVQILPVSGAA